MIRSGSYKSKVRSSIYTMEDRKCRNQKPHCTVSHGRHFSVRMEPNHFDEEAAAFFLERTKNNVGLIIHGIAPIKDTIGGHWLWKNKKMFQKLKPFMDEIHKTGTKLFVQITAGMGRSWAIADHMVTLHNSPILSKIVKPIIRCTVPVRKPQRTALSLV